MKKSLFLVFIICSIAITAQTKLPSFFGDNMVLQQKDSVNIWGTDKPNCTITISGSWGKEVSTKSER